MRYCAILAAAVALPLAAQDHQHGGDDPTRLGRVDFPISCPTIQAPFERAMALLHSFWWDEAARAFGELTTQAPECGMAWWGLALTHWNNPFAGGPSGTALAAGAAAAEQAARVDAPTVREQHYIVAVNALYRDHATTPNAQRLQAYSDRMGITLNHAPDDTEAAIYYSLSLVATASPTDTTFTRQRQAHAILEPLFLARPDHPGLAHYVIHANDSPRLAAQGLRAARAYADIAPSVPHAQHMPSHIFIRLGLWQENIDANRRSYEAGASYARAERWEGLGGHEFHAMDYMVYGYLQLGQDSAARYWTDYALSVTDVHPGRALISEDPRAAIPARLALERDRWADAAQVPIVTTTPVAQFISLFSRGMGAARGGDAAGARSALSAFEAMQATLERDPYWSRVAGIKHQALRAWVLLIEGDTTQALAEARLAAVVEDVTEKHPVTPGEVLPARELYGDMLLATGQYAEARAAYEAALTREPGRARSIYGAARASEMAGDRAVALEWYGRYLQLMEHADGTRAEIAAARRAVGSR